MQDIKLVNIKKKYKDKVILKNFNLEIKQGEFLSIYGQSGCGKSTLLNIIGMLEKPSSGDVIIGKHKNPLMFSKIGKNILRNEISYLFQNFGLIDNESVQYNLKIALRYLGYPLGVQKSVMENALIRVGLSDVLTKKIFELSGGEQQRVAIAKCLIKPSNIILADEPTGSVDAKNRDKILQLLKDINEQERKTIIVVTHDLEIVKCTERSLNLNA